MAPLAAYNLTDRYTFRYISGGDATRAVEHDVLWRFPFDGTQSHDDVQNKFLGFLSALTSGFFRSGWAVTAVLYSAANTSFFTPVALLPALAAFNGVGSYTGWVQSAEAIEYRFLGRSALTGVRSKFSLYGSALNSIADFRIGLESSAVTAATDYLNAASPPLLVAGDNTVPTWYPFADLNYNSYWEGALRT